MSDEERKPLGTISPVVVTVVSKDVVVGSINGVEQHANMATTALVCMDCGQVLYEFGQGITPMEAEEELVRHGQDEMEVAFGRYCRNCGKRLRYDFYEPIVFDDDKEAKA